MNQEISSFLTLERDKDILVIGMGIQCAIISHNLNILDALNALIKLNKWTEEMVLDLMVHKSLESIQIGE